MGLARIWKNRYTHSHAALHVKWYSHYEKSLMVPQKVTHRITVWVTIYIFILWGIYVFQRTESICPHKNVCTNVYSGIIHNSKEVGTTQRFTELWHIHTNLKRLNTIQPSTVLKYWGMLQLGWTLKTLCYVREARHKRASYCTIPFTWNVHYRYIYRDRRPISGCQGLEGGANGEWLMGGEFPFGVMEKFWN